MTKNHTVRRVTKRVYDQYSYSDYDILTDNLNPVNPTQLENQFTEMLHTVQKRIIDAYDKAKVKIPEELFDPDVSPNTLLNDVNSLLNKLKGNPLSDLYGDLGNLDALVPFISSPDKADSIGDNPLKLDCSGIETTLKSSTNTASRISGLSEGTTEDDNESPSGPETGSDKDSPLDAADDISSKINITYKNLEASEDMSKYPTTLLEVECPVTIATPLEAPGTKVFGGWYYDSNFNVKVPNASLDWPGKDVVLYARFKDPDADDNDKDATTPGNDLNLAFGYEEDDCDLVELAFLKIILIIIIIAKVLIQVLVIIVAVMKTAAEVIKEAQLCWINPPMLQSLIGYVMQRLSAIIFQILGLILLKLWAMLNLDCISKNTVNTISQINAALAGITDLLGSLDKLSINFSDSNSANWKTLKETIKNLKDQLQDQAEKVWDDFGNVGETLKKAGKDIADTYTNPSTYLNAVPDEIKNSVLEDINEFNSLKNNITQLQATINNLTNKNSKVQNELPKGTSVVFNG